MNNIDASKLNNHMTVISMIVTNNKIKMTMFVHFQINIKLKKNLSYFPFSLFSGFNEILIIIKV